MSWLLLVAAAGSTALLPPVVARSSLLAGLLCSARSVSSFRFPLSDNHPVFILHLWQATRRHDAFAVIWWSVRGSRLSILWSEAAAAEVVYFFPIRPAPSTGSVRGRLSWPPLALCGVVCGWGAARTSVLTLSILQPLHGLTFA